MHFPFGGHLAHHSDALSVVLMRSVRSVQPEYVDSGIEQASHYGFGIGGRPERGNDFSGWHVFQMKNGEGTLR